MNRLYVLTGVAVMALYAAADWYGWEVATPPRQVVPADVRHAPGGYRSFHFWHTGWQGGK